MARADKLTERLFTKALPELSQAIPPQAEPDKIAIELRKYHLFLETVIGSCADVTGAVGGVVAELADNTNRDKGSLRELMVGVANNATITPPTEHTEISNRAVRLHKGVGGIVAVDANFRPVTWGLTPSSTEDPKRVVQRMFETLGWAVVAESAQHQGADWGGGYTAVEEALKLVDFGSIERTFDPEHPPIGSATTHSVNYVEVPPGTNRFATGYAGSGGRVLSDKARRVIAAGYTELFSSMTGSHYANERDLAGLIATLTGFAALGVRFKGQSQGDASRIQLPDLSSSGRQFVNLN